MTEFCYGIRVCGQRFGKWLVWCVAVEFADIEGSRWGVSVMRREVVVRSLYSLKSPLCDRVSGCILRVM
jgi:hypothetical protein